MAFENLPRTSFAGGELSPQMTGRPDLPIYAAGARVLENCHLTKTGGAQKRAGWEVVERGIAVDELNAAGARLVAVPGIRGRFSVLVLGARSDSGVVALREYPIGAAAGPLRYMTSQDAPAPPVPTNLVCTAGNMFITVSFNRSSGATDYDYRFRLMGDNWSEVVTFGDIEDPEITIMGLVNDREYEIQVRARHDQSESDWSASVYCAPALVSPQTPGGLTVEGPASGGLRITHDRVLGATQYQIRIRVVEGVQTPWDETHELAPLRTTVRRLHNNILAGLQYEVQVRAWNADPSPWSESVFGTPLIGTAPQSPMRPDLEIVGVGEVEITFDRIPGAEFYAWEWRTDETDWNPGARIEQTESGRVVARATGLQARPGVRYYFHVRSGRGTELSDWSIEASTFLIPATPPNLAVSQSDQRRTITWDTVEGAEGYILERETRTIFGAFGWTSRQQIYRGENNSFPDFDGAHIDHRYRVRAFLGEVRSAWSDWEHDPGGAVR